MKKREQNELTAEALEEELQKAQKKLEETERLIETVEEELEEQESELQKALRRAREEEYETGGNCCEDFDEEEGR